MSIEGGRLPTFADAGVSAPARPAKHKWKTSRNISPLSPEEITSVLETAQALDTGGGYHGWSYTHTFLFFLRVGIHPRVLTRRWEPRIALVDEGGEHYIQWRRPKKRDMMAGTTRLPVSKEIAAFIVEFVARPFPLFRQHWFHLFKKLGAETLKRHPEHPGIGRLCPLALRHTCCVELLRRGVSPEFVRQALNVSPSSMAYYSKLVPKMLTEQLRKVEW